MVYSKYIFKELPPLSYKFFRDKDNVSILVVLLLDLLYYYFSTKNPLPLIGPHTLKEVPLVY